MLPSPENDITIRTLDDILNKATRRTWTARSGSLVVWYAPISFRGDQGLRVILNGKLLKEEDLADTLTKPGDEVIFYRAPQGIELLIFAGISIALSGISFAVSALTAPSTKALGPDLDESPTYGWDAISNTVRPGTAISIVYGAHRVGGHIIQQFQREARNTSTTTAVPKSGELHTLLAPCTGPIENIDSVRVNQNPITDYGETVTWEARLGGDYQAAITGFRDVVSQAAKDSVLEAAKPPLVFTTAGQVDAFEIVFRFPGGLYGVSRSGQYTQKVVYIKVEYREVGEAGWYSGGTKAISQRTSNAFDSWYESPRVPRAQYEIRLTRITPDDTEPTGYSTANILSVNDVTEETLTYPRIALLAVRQLPTNQVAGSPPSYDALVKGKRVRVYTDLSTYTEAWSDNPAWCLLDLLTNKFDGLGAWISDSQIDLQAFLDWAAFCDELVPVDEGGATEKRFRLDLVLDGALTAIDAIKQICMTGQAGFYLKGDKWSVRVEKAEEPVQFFQMTRIHKDSFSVKKRSKTDIANLLVGQFWNADLDYEQDTLPREDPTLVEGEDQREKTINLLGTTRVSQANRILNYFMLDNRLIRREVEFEVGTEALAMEAGDVFKLAHDVPGWGYSGQIRKVLDPAGTGLVLDRTVTIEAGKTYELTLIHNSDSIDVVSVTNNPETTNQLSVSGDWSQVPVAGVDYSFGEVTRSTALYRCTSITSSSDPTKRKIRAREYNAAVYGSDLTVLPPPSISRIQNPNTIPDDIRDLRLVERQVYAEDGTLSVAIDIHFTLPSVTGARAIVFWRREGDLYWEPAGPPVEIGYFSIEREVESPGTTYEVSVLTLSPSGNRKHPDQGVRGTITTVGTTRQPDNVVGFTVDRTLSGLVFRWDPLDPVRNFDLAYYEVRDGASWDAAVKVGQTNDTTLETSAFVAGTRTFLVKAYNTAGKASPQAAAVVMFVEDRIGENVVYTRQEDPSWPGTKESMSIDGADLELDTKASIVAWRAGLVATPKVSSLIPGGYGVGFRVTGSYTTAPFEVSTEAIRCLISTDVEADQVDTTLFWDAAVLADKVWDSDFARSRSWAVAPDGRVTVRVQMRFSTTTSDDSAFSAWQERAQNIEALVRWAQVRVLVTVQDPAWTVVLRRLRIIFDVPDVVEGGTVQTDTLGTVAVAFAKAFHAEPKVAATVIGATAGDEIYITAKNKTGFSIEVKNATVRVARTVNYTVVGY